MEFSALKATLADPHEFTANAFAVLREIARRVNHLETHNEGRELVIRALPSAGKLSEPDRAILMSLVRSVGLFPYMTEHLSATDMQDYIAYELHRADNLGQGIIFHSLQAHIYHQLMAGANVVLSASTSVGKSLVIDAVLASKRFHKVVIVVPTIALIDETRKRLAKQLGDSGNLITHPTQQAKNGRINVYVLTQERVLHRDDLQDIDLFVVDEFYKVNLGDDEHNDRAVDLNLALHKLLRTNAQFYLLGPNIQKISGLERYEYHFIPSEFSTVAVDVTNLNLPTRGEARNEKLLELCESLDGPTIVYCQSPRSASDVASLLADKARLGICEATSDAVQWINEHFHPDWIVARALAQGIGIHHGGVPRALQQYFIRLFNERQIRFLVCTSTIIEGVNTVAKNVIVYDRRKSRDVLDHFTYKNIEGRAGRMREYFVGKVIVLETPPADKGYAVEFPIGKQGPSTPLSLLLDLPSGDLIAPSRERLDALFRESSLSPETLRLNRHTPVDAQESVAAAIRENLSKYGKVLSWTGTVPRQPQLLAVCNLIFDHLSQRALQEYDVHSGRSLAWHLNGLRTTHNLSAYIRQCVDSRRDGTPSEAVENCLRFVRNMISHRFPRDLMAIDSIQREIFEAADMPAGDYSYFAEQAETMFMPSVLYALDEYGVPVQLAQRLSRDLLPSLSLDEVLEKLKRLRAPHPQLSAFEGNVLERVREGI